MQRAAREKQSRSSHPEYQLLFLIESVDIAALIQLPDEAQIGKVLRISRLAFELSVQDCLDAFEGRILLFRQNRFAKQIFPSFVEDVAIDVTADIFGQRSNRCFLIGVDPMDGVYLGFDIAPDDV